MAGIYIVDVKDGESETRAIVIAPSAQNAADPYEAVGRTVTVGRIGTYEPGNTGALLAGVNPDELVIGPAPR
jgi:hypothetical protein